MNGEISLVINDFFPRHYMGVLFSSEKYQHNVNDMSAFDPFSFSSLNCKLVFDKTCHV